MNIIVYIRVFTSRTAHMIATADQMRSAEEVTYPKQININVKSKFVTIKAIFNRSRVNYFFPEQSLKVNI